MTRKFAAALCGFALMSILGMLLADRIVHVPAAPYESEYFRTDPPAFHETLSKRLMKFSSGGAVEARTLIQNRRAVSVLRMAGLAALLGFLLMQVSPLPALTAFALFLSLPPTFVYFVRLDTWMDGVCFTFLALATCSPMAQGRWSVWACFFSGVCAGLAVDAKLTALLTLVPMAVWLAGRVRKGLWPWFLMGVLAGFGLSSPSWMVDPSSAVAHISYWRMTNDAVAPAPLADLARSLTAAVPVTLWAFAVYGWVRDFRSSRSLMWSLVLFSAPVVFLLVYRTVPPDGIRHFFLALPFLCIPAASAWSGAPTAVRLAAAVCYGAELVF